MVKRVKIELHTKKFHSRATRGFACTDKCTDKHGDPCGTGLVGSIAYGLASCQLP